ncbi:MAG: aminoglycoside phosphotransferase family protein [Caldilineaceae bacterium]|nr:aminoglycoside phosphotransferase family protein [Caldilineaceae bacterium]
MTQDSAGTQNVIAYLSSAEQWSRHDHVSGFDDAKIEIIDRWQGRDNLLWRFRTGDQDGVLKLFMEAGQVRADRQFSGQERFAPWGLAPRPLWQERQPDALPRPLLVYAWIDGDIFDPADLGGWEALAETVARIHTEELGDYGRFSPHPINLSYFWRVWQGSRDPLAAWVRERKVDALGAILAEMWDAVEGMMAAALPVFGETAPALIHGDLVAEHVIFHRGQALLLDWELFGLGDPAQDAARLLFFNGQIMDPSAEARWLDRYLARMDEPGLESRIEIYRRILPFQSLTSLLTGIGREIANDPAQMGELEGSRPFLVETMATALLHATGSLLADPLREDMDDLRGQFDHLLRIGD